MGIGARSPVWRRVLFRSFSSVYVRRKCVTHDGAFAAYVSGGSSLRLLSARGLGIDRVHQRFIDRWVKPDSVVWDVGANLGLFAFAAALEAARGRVYAFEPDVELAANLLRSNRLPQNRSLTVSVFCMAASDCDATANFQLSKFSRAMNKLEDVGRWHQDQVSVLETRSVATLRVDTLTKTLDAPSIMKIDVEGAEVRVLEGAEQTIARHRPAILIEGPSELWDPMAGFFRRQGYVMFDGAVDDPKPLDHPVWDTVAIPQESAAVASLISSSDGG